MLRYSHLGPSKSARSNQGSFQDGIGRISAVISQVCTPWRSSSNATSGDPRCPNALLACAASCQNYGRPKRGDLHLGADPRCSPSFFSYCCLSPRACPDLSRGIASRRQCELPRRSSLPHGRVVFRTVACQGQSHGIGCTRLNPRASQRRASPVPIPNRSQDSQHVLGYLSQWGRGD